MTWFRSSLERVSRAAVAAGWKRAEVLDSYTSAAPTAQTAIDVFAGQWTSRLPAPLDRLHAGRRLLFEDPRVAWAIERLGGVAGKRVLELGPLEGGHSYMLDRAGATEVVAIEANSRAFLKCLVVKEVVGMPSVRFLHGDFMAYLRDGPEPFDVVFASGVLYHSVNPVELIARIADVSGAVYLWTHYYDEARLAANPVTSHLVVAATPSEHRGYEHSLYRYEYRAALADPGFCGGSRPFANWMTREGILDALRHVGLARLEIHGEQLDHELAPAFAILARRGPADAVVGEASVV